jgi:RimJ/RimL family protein N-acetyltransferase
MKLELKRLTQKDLYKLTAIIDNSIANDARLEWPFSRETAETFINDYDTWGIWLNNGILVGALEVKADGETAYLVAKQWQAKGIATWAVTEIKKKFHARQLWCLIHPANRASLRVAQKAIMRIQYLQ